MSISANVAKVSFKQALEIARVAAETKTAMLLIGDPGVGKTALANMISKELNKPLVTLIGSTLDSTDVGGLPALVGTKDKKEVWRFPLQQVRQACERPCVLFLDELSTCPPPVQAAFLRLVFEGWAGDYKLHPDTVVLLATNPEEQSPGGVPLSPPMIGRTVFLHLRPTPEEVFEYFNNLEGDEFLREEALNFVLTAKCMPDLLQIDCPKDAEAGNKPWGAPRSWERVIRTRATAARNKLDQRTAFMLTAGSVGMDIATSYTAILDLRDKLPSVDQIVKDPKKVKLPAGKELQANIAAASLVPRVAAQDLWAAWLYADRLPPELRITCFRELSTSRYAEQEKMHRGSPFMKEGHATRLNVLKETR